jgi:hypothetical protein
VEVKTFFARQKCAIRAKSVLRSFDFMNEQIVILDFGSQYTQVIARRIRECNVYSVILRYDTPAVKIAGLKPSGIILSGGPSSVYAKDAPLPDKNIFTLGVPVRAVQPPAENVAGLEFAWRQAHEAAERVQAGRRHGKFRIRGH